MIIESIHAETNGSLLKRILAEERCEEICIDFINERNNVEGDDGN